MSSTDYIKQVLSDINNNANEILENGGGDEDLLYSLADVTDKIKEVMDASTHSELDGFCHEYEGFRRYMVLINIIAENIENGTLPVPN